MMLRHHILPAGLITLLFSSFSLAQQQLVSPFDPFRDIAKLAQPSPDPPVCCLKPLTPSEPNEELLLSFEEWKEKQERSLHAEQDGDGKGGAAKSNSPPIPSDTLSEPPGEDIEDDGTRQEKPPVLPPAHFRVPIVDRFNFASSDCSARVHYSHRSARSASSLLTSKKDKYMLSPCNTPGEDKFVVVELCDFIRIDTVQLANFEFFSGVFKDFSISVSATSPADPEAWIPAGIYRAKNIRGIQTFHPDTSALRDFYRFIRIDFHSHYGNEFYCPVSLLRVYGLTDLEQWKWEVWESEYNQRQAAAGRRAIEAGQSSSAEKVVEIIRETAKPEVQAEAVNDSIKFEKTSFNIADTIPTLTTTVETMSSAEAFKATSMDNEIVSSIGSPLATADSLEAMSVSPSITSIPSPSSPVESATVTSKTVVDSHVSEATSDAQPESSPTSDPQPEPPQSDSESLSIPTTSTTVQTFVSQEARIPPGPSGESIYRTIMTRLSSLESNSTLYVRYVEEQTRSVHDALKRLEEDVGRLEGITKAQAQFLQKTVSEWDRQRKRFEREHGDLQARVDNLADEIILEKRLGIAQLCLLLTVLVFMVLTRGSRGEPILSPLTGRQSDSLKEWGRRHLNSFGSGDWSKSERASGLTLLEEDAVKKIDKVKFPSERTPDDALRSSQPSSFKVNLSTPRRRTPSEIRAPHPRHFVSHRPKTPTTANHHPPRSATHAYSQSAGLPSLSAGARPRLRRTNSSNAPESLPISMSLSGGLSAPLASAKKWAKSAHLHEIRKPKNENASPSPTKPDFNLGRGERGLEEALKALSSPRLEAVKPPGTDRTMFWFETPPTSDDIRHGESRGRSKERSRANRDESNPKAPWESRRPLSTSSEQNRTRERSETLIPADIEHFRLGSPYQGRTSINGSVDGRQRILDIDTESESWIDTDVESSDMGDRDMNER